MLPADQMAVYWIEHVLRHGNAEHLQLASGQMPFHQRYLLDVAAFLVVSIGLFSAAVAYGIRQLIRTYCRTSRTKLSRE